MCISHVHQILIWKGVTSDVALAPIESKALSLQLDISWDKPGRKADVST